MENEKQKEQIEISAEENLAPSVVTVDEMKSDDAEMTHEIEQKMLEKELKNQRIHHQLLELYLQKDGLGKAASTALVELKQLAKFNLDDDGKLVILDSFGEKITPQSGSDPVESFVEEFLTERDYLLASKWNNKLSIDRNDLTAQLQVSGGSKKNRLDFGKRLIGDEPVASEYSYDQEPAERYIRRRTLELENSSNNGSVDDDKPAGISSKKGRLNLAKSLTENSSD